MNRQIIACSALILMTLLQSCDYFKFIPDCSEVTTEATPSQFTALPRGVVSDQITGLTWSRCAVGSNYIPTGNCIGEPLLMSFDSAQAYVRETADKSSVAWRLPTINEFKSIIRENCQNPALDQTLFPDSLVENHWVIESSNSPNPRACTIFTFQGASLCRLDRENLFPFMIVTNDSISPSR